MDPATFAVALFGAVTGGGSLAWNIRSFHLSGPKVAVRLGEGLAGPGGVIAHQRGATTVHPREDEYPVPVLIVVASTRGGRRSQSRGG